VARVKSPVGNAKLPFCRVNKRQLLLHSCCLGRPLAFHRRARAKAGKDKHVKGHRGPPKEDQDQFVEDMLRKRNGRDFLARNWVLFSALSLAGEVA